MPVLLRLTQLLGQEMFGGEYKFDRFRLIWLLNVCIFIICCRSFVNMT